jgi:hypothetical protein
LQPSFSSDCSPGHFPAWVACCEVACSIVHVTLFILFIILLFIQSSF